MKAALLRTGKTKNPLENEGHCIGWRPRPLRIRTLRKLARLRHETASLAIAALTRRGVLEATDHSYRLLDVNLRPADRPVPGSHTLGRGNRPPQVSKHHRAMQPGIGGLAPYYEDDGVVIYHGDCQRILPTLPSCSIDFVLTDPPYLVNYAGRWDGERKMIVGDDDPTWLVPVFREIWQVLKADSYAISFCGWPLADVFVGTFKALGFRPVSHLAFVKNVWGLGRFTRGQHETAYLLAKGRPPRPRRGISDVIEWEREQGAVHPNQKPVAALYPLIAAYTPPGGVVLDPFMGSGSTLRAAKDFGLSAIGIEVEERYCRYAAGRMRQRILFSRLTD